VVACRVIRMDVLLLGPALHRRAQIHWERQAWASTWVSP
jgi:hypothetical protein